MFPPLSKLIVRFEPVVNIPLVKVSVPLTARADKSDAPAALFTVILYKEGTPVIVCAVLPAKTTVEPATEFIVPLFVIFPYAFKTPVLDKESVAPELMVIAAAAPEEVTDG